MYSSILLQGVFDHTMRYVNERTAFGKHIGDFQGVQFQYASLYAGIFLNL